MTDKKWTLLIVIFTIVALIGWDIYVVFLNDEPTDSISEWIQLFGDYALITPFAWGVLGGHFFWPGRPIFGQPKSVIVLGAMGIGLTALGLFLPAIPMKALLSLLLGIPAGHYLWPLRPRT